MRRVGRRAWCVLVLALASGACRDRAKQERDETALHEAHDVASLGRLVELDQGLDRALKEADDASSKGDDAKAAGLLDGLATQAADAALAFARATPAESAWGQARREAIVAVLEERRAEIPRYAAALRGTDLDAKLAAVEAQLALQKRAMTAASAALRGPEDARVDAGLDASAAR